MQTMIPNEGNRRQVNSKLLMQPAGLGIRDLSGEMERFQGLGPKVLTSRSCGVQRVADRAARSPGLEGDEPRDGKRLSRGILEMELAVHNMQSHRSRGAVRSPKDVALNTRTRSYEKWRINCHCAHLH